MTTIKSYLLLTICVFALYSANAQMFKSVYLESIYDNLPETIKDSGEGVIGGFNVDIEYDSDGVISQMGVDLPIFDQDTTLISSFSERFFLDLLLATREHDRKNVLDRSKCKLYFNGAEYQKGPFWSLSSGLRTLKECRSFDVKRDSLSLSMRWSDGSNTLDLTIPANIQIITGLDKPELESGLERLMLSHTNKNVRYAESNVSKYTAFGDDLYLNIGKNFLIDSLTNTTYYTKNKRGKFEVIYNPDRLAESFANLFLCSTKESEKTKLRIEQHMYGRNTRGFEVTIGTFHSFCKANGLEVYVGFERIEQSEVEASIILHNREYNYIHLLHIISNVDSMFSSKEQSLEARMFAYIPFDNVAELFE